MIEQLGLMKMTLLRRVPNQLPEEYMLVEECHSISLSINQIISIRFIHIYCSIASFYVSSIIFLNSVVTIKDLFKRCLQLQKSDLIT